MIELAGKYGHAKLSILSHTDYIWGLDYLHTKKKRPIAFHFQSSHLSEAQDWYMTLYQLLLLHKTKMIGKAPLPPFVDLIIPEMDHFVIQIPLHALTDKQPTSSVIYNIRMSDLKLTALRILEYKGIKPSNWVADNVSLCWTLDSHTEWVTESQNVLLVGSQLIEQKHKLELWYFGDQKMHSHQEVTISFIFSLRSMLFFLMFYFCFSHFWTAFLSLGSGALKHKQRSIKMLVKSMQFSPGISFFKSIFPIIMTK